MEPIVWSVREPRNKDVTDASHHGRLCHIFQKDVSPLDIPEQTRIIRSEVLPHASATDMIMTVGPQIMFGNLVGLWVQHFGEARFLVWNSARKRYEVRWISATRKE
jgi:hypothetical protein